MTPEVKKLLQERDAKIEEREARIAELERRETALLHFGAKACRLLFQLGDPGVALFDPGVALGEESFHFRRHARKGLY